jgi:hypothetical protein
MPWSPWIQSPNDDQPPAARRHITWFEADGYSIASDLAANVTDFAGAQASIDPPFRGHMATQYRVRDGWDANTFLPPELGALTQGVDFGIKPGADPTDPFRFVDYDPDDHAEVVGWTIPSPVVYDRMGDFDLGADLWIDPITDYDTGVVAPLAVGVTFDTINPTTPAGTVLATPPDPGSTLSFTVGISPHIPLDNEGAVNVIMTGSLFTSVWPRVTVRPQRWRYWIPTLVEPPLRQSQRHDGLGRSGTPRWSGGVSRQTSNRWRSPR